MAVAYGSAGAGGGTETSGASLDLACPATVNAGEVLIAHTTFEGLTNVPSTPSGWTLLYGPANLGTGTAIGRSWVFGKIADGTEDGATIGFGSHANVSGRWGRIYSFTGRVSGTINQICLGFSNIPTEGSIPLPTVSTVLTGGLAVALLTQDDNNAFAAAGAQTGGTWAEPVAEFVSTTLGAQGCIVGIQTSTPTANPGTISGGTANATADEGSSIGFSIQADPPAFPAVFAQVAVIGATGTTVSVTLPTVKDNDIAIVTLYVEDSNDAVTPASGFTEKPTTFPNTTGPTAHHTFWKRLAASDSGASTGNFSWASSVYRELVLTIIRGAVDSGDPIELTNTAQSNAATSLNVSLTGTATDSLLYAAMTSFDIANVTPPTGFTELQDVELIGDSFKSNAAGGNTGTLTYTCSVNSAVTAVLLSILKLSGSVALVVADALQAQSTDAIDLTQHNVLVVADATQAQLADNLTLTIPGTPLLVQDALQAQSSDEVVLTQHNVLAVADATQAQSTDAIVLTQHNVLAVADALQAQSTDAIALTQHHALAVADALQAHTADNVVLTVGGGGPVALVVADALQAQSSDEVVLTQHHILAVQDALQAQLAENLVLTLPSAGAAPATLDAYLKAPISEAGITDGAPEAPRISAPAAASGIAGGGGGGW